MLYRLLWMCSLLLMLSVSLPMAQRSVQKGQEDHPKTRPYHNSSHDSSDATDEASGYTICIDPGHSRQTVGARGRYLHLLEYKVCWQMAERLKAALEAKGDRVILTKPDENPNVGNDERARIANRSHADLFLRLHCDSGPDNGTATFYPAGQGTIRGKTGPSSRVIAQSRICAHAFHKAMMRALGGALNNRGVRTDAQTAVGGKLGGALEGSIYAEVPVLLVEMCVLDNRHDETFIGSDRGKTLLARAMAEGAQAAVKANRK